jgi:uncharacterized membrane protein (DUF485 family)
MSPMQYFIEAAFNETVNDVISISISIGVMVAILTAVIAIVLSYGRIFFTSGRAWGLLCAALDEEHPS